MTCAWGVLHTSIRTTRSAMKKLSQFVNNYLRGDVRFRTSRKAGFSLLELLVVISIISILVAMGVAGFTTAQRKARDARRSGDLKAIQTAQEIYYSANNSTYASISGCNGSVLQSAGVLDVFPTDPRTPTTSYTCNYNATGGYCVVAQMESGGGNCGGCSCNATSCTFTAGTTAFCVKNLQ